MRLSFLLTTFIVATTWMIASVTLSGADEGRPVKILARGSWPHLPTHLRAGSPAQRQWVIRQPEELAKVAGKGALLTVPKALGLAKLDFTQQMLLVVEDGTQPLVGVSGGGAPSAPSVIEIPRIAVDEAGKTMTVSWQLTPRGKDSPIITRPLLAVVVKRFEGDVKFDKLPTRSDASKEKPAGGKETPILAQALWPDGWPAEAPRKEWVIRSEQELIDRRLRAPEHVLEEMRKKALAQYVKALRVAEIDFSRQMIVGVSGGVQESGIGVNVLRAEVDSKGTTMTIYWSLSPAAAGRKEVGIAHPAEVLLVDQFEGEVQFKEEPAKKEGRSK
ncbi:MAG: hypothetical protein K8R36_04850 [Planctomycetales bacterium]|nr:hypothetical protein [Planctomycetales bacterium]